MSHESLTSRVYLESIDPELLTFLRQYVNSFIKWDLLYFFYHNPHTIDTVENIARYAGRDHETVELELAELAQRGLLEQTRMGDMVIYALTDDPEVRVQLKKFIAASADREFRVRAVYHVIRDMRKG